MGSGLLWGWRCFYCLESWSLAAEVSLLSAFELAGGPTPDRGFRCGRGVARFRSTVLGGPVVGKARADFADAEDGQFCSYL